MRAFIGFIARTGFVLFLLALISAGGALYWLHLKPRDISGAQSYILRFLTEGKPLEVYAYGGSMFFDAKRRTINMTFRQTRLNYKDEYGILTRAEIPLASVDVPVTPGELSWLKPVLTLYNTKLYLPPAPQGPPPPKKEHSREKWHSFLRFLDQGAMAYLTDIVLDKAKLLDRVGALCAQRTVIFRAGEHNPETNAERLDSLCVKRNISLAGKETLDVVAGLERDGALFRSDDNPHVRILWYRSPRVRAGMDITVYSASAASLAHFPYIGRGFSALPFAPEYISGVIRMTADKDGRPDDIILNIKETAAALPDGNGKGQDLHITLKKLYASCSEFCTRIKITDGTVALKEWNVEAALSADIRAGSITLETMAQTPEMFIGSVAATFESAELKDIYAAADAMGYSALRSRFSSYLTEGKLDAGTVTLAFPDAVKEETPADAVTANLQFSEARIHAPEHNITLSGINGSAQYWDRTVTATLQGGKGNGYALKQTDVTAELYRNKITVKGAFSGDMQQLAPMVPAKVKEDSRALRYLLNYGKASAAATFEAIAPINSAKTPAPERIIEVKAQFKETRLPALFPFTDITGGTFTADISAGKKVAVNGTATLARRKTQESLDEAPFVSLPGRYIAVGDGQAGIDLVITPAVMNGKKASDMVLNVDAAGTEVFIPPADYRKAPGVPATFTLAGKGAEGTLATRELRYISGDDRLISDEAFFSAAKVTLSAREAKIGAQNIAFDFRLPEDRNAEAAPSVTGKHIDMNRILSGLKAMQAAPAERRNAPALAIDVDVASVKFFKKTTLREAKGRLVCRNGYCGDIYAEGIAGKGGRVTFLLAPSESDNTQGRMAFTAEPAGEALLALLPNSHYVNGGAAKIDGTMKKSASGYPAAEGTLILTDARLKKMPALSKLLAAASLRGAGDYLTGEEGLAVDKLYAPFTYRDKVITIKDAATSGAALGLTAGGTLDFNKSFVDIEGVIVPAQGGVNKIVSEIPLLGDLLTGGKNKGILSANYTFSGKMSAPQVSVNPFSLLAPGILRNIFPAFPAQPPGK